MHQGVGDERIRREELVGVKVSRNSLVSSSTADYALV